MSGGAGHIADMNNRMKQNRSMKASKKPKFKSNNRDLNFSKSKSEKLTFQKVSKHELIHLKKRIKRKAESERKKERIIIALTTLILIIILTIFLIYYFAKPYSEKQKSGTIPYKNNSSLVLKKSPLCVFFN
jgi:hypothetical protein